MAAELQSWIWGFNQPGQPKEFVCLCLLLLLLLFSCVLCFFWGGLCVHWERWHYMYSCRHTVVPNTVLLSCAHSICNSVQNGWDTHQKLAIICAFPLVFQEIALNPIYSPSPLSMLSMQDCPIDFAARTTLKWGGGVKENKDVQDWKKPKHSVSTLFAQECGKMVVNTNSNTQPFAALTFWRSWLLAASHC